MGKIVVVGSFNVDFIMEIDSMPRKGETIIGKGFEVGYGGKGANQAITAARLGGNVVMVGCVGDDVFSSQIFDNFKKEGIDISLVKKVNNISTGSAFVIIHDSDNMLLVDPGANNLITFEQIEKLNFTEEDILILQYEIKEEVIIKAAEMAKEKGTKIILNPAPFKKMSEKIYEMSDIITPNQTEAEFLTGVTINNENDAKMAINIFRKKYKDKTIIITMGSMGAVYNIGDEIFHKPVEKVKVVDTTGAGDSFNGALAVSLMENKTLDDAVIFANKVASVSVTKKGAQVSFPMRKDII